jgi:hypothetical protein
MRNRDTSGPQRGGSERAPVPHLPGCPGSGHGSIQRLQPAREQRQPASVSLSFAHAWPSKKSASIMSDLDKLKKENKQLKTLLKKAVRLLNDYKDILKRQETLATAKKDKKKKKKKKKA